MSTEMHKFQKNSLLKEFQIQLQRNEDAQEVSVQERRKQMATGKKEKNKFGTMSNNPFARPLDFSFQEIKSFAELAEHETNDNAGGKKKAAEADDKAQEKTPEDEPEKQLDRSKVVGVRLSYNEFTNVDGIVEALSLLMDNPVENLQMLDLSHNQLTTIDPILATFTNLTVLYLHGNQISNLNEIKKLKTLVGLRKLTLHGNSVTILPPPPPPGSRGADTIVQKKVKRLEETKYYRMQCIFYLRTTLLSSLDQVPVTPKDRMNSLIWAKNHKKQRKPRESAQVI